MQRAIVHDTVFLSQVSKEAQPSDVHLAKDLRDTLAANRENCLGMAANMIGSTKRVIIVNMGFLDIVMFNPRLIAKKDPYPTQESCLSLTGSRPTLRFREITVQYRNEDWQEKTITLKDLSAQICQHELDHLQGILI